MSELDLTELDEWIEATLLPLSGVEGASRQPAGLNLPGVLVQVIGLGVDTLGADDWRVDLRFLLITPDTDVVSATDDLVRLLNAVRPALGEPAGDYTPTTFQGDSATYPALSFTHTVRITKELDQT